MKRIITFLFFFGIMPLSAQVTLQKTTKDNDLKLSALPYYNYGKGLGITSPDSIFQFNIRFRVQNRATYLQEEGEESAIDGQIRRLRLRFDGYVGDPRFIYAIQLSFAPGDVGEVKEGENLNIIRDAVVFYRPTKHWNIGFGQTKLPGNRQRVNSSGALQLSDRTINNAKFNIDRDFGFQLHNQHEAIDKFSYNLRSAITMGEGRNSTDEPDNGLAYTGKFELYPFGAFTKDGAYFEGDLKRETTPKLMLSGAYQFNNKARRTGGQLGNDLFEKRDMQSLFLDGMVKYNGWAFMAAYMQRFAKDPITVNPEDATDIEYIFTGNGMDYQLSYLFPSNYELIGRFSKQKANSDIAVLAPDAKQYSIGFTKYVWEHAFKAQLEFTLDELSYFDNTSKQNWYIRFQVEMGI
ncbi:OprO/OprP family phosphate-selective porin [Flavobacterium sp. MFBS3-15]|uniref:OprO/OprP family phosphate-selective porin n=1 Tax=Flavobacterium sp. MFBS3-15 TaxID=2989816 RepID=UPI002235CA4D|nr:OprO/OprP family phosphate-selective porin [Flavobacterium sp. MFBS3-15]MCW4468537.1 OprO/OprP family phosphate-selective porin [Flavobacterium sp. MFBS3-15]